MRDWQRMAKKMQLDLQDAPQLLCTELGNSCQQQGKDTAKDPERFDDSDFYQLLLKELLETKSAGTAGLGLQPISKARKGRNQCDRRASKGRRLRYAVQVCILRHILLSNYFCNSPGRLNSSCCVTGEAGELHGAKRVQRSPLSQPTFEELVWTAPRLIFSKQTTFSLANKLCQPGSTIRRTL